MAGTCWNKLEFTLAIHGPPVPSWHVQLFNPLLSRKGTNLKGAKTKTTCSNQNKKEIQACISINLHTWTQLYVSNCTNLKCKDNLGDYFLEEPSNKQHPRAECVNCVHCWCLMFPISQESGHPHSALRPGVAGCRGRTWPGVEVVIGMGRTCPVERVLKNNIERQYLLMGWSSSVETRSGM